MQVKGNYGYERLGAQIQVRSPEDVCSSKRNNGVLETIITFEQTCESYDLNITK